MTPAFLSFNASFNSNEWGIGAAIAFILFAIIVFFTMSRGSSPATRTAFLDGVASGRRRPSATRMRRGSPSP